VLAPGKRRWSAFGGKFAGHPSPDACLALAKQYLDANRLMEAMVVCKKGVKSEPNNLAGHVLLARIFLAQCKRDRAVGTLQQVLRAHPDSSEAAQLLDEI